MNYKEITADEYERLLKNKNDIFNKTFKNTDKLVEDNKQILKTDPDAIIKKQQKDEYIEKLSNIISEKIIDGKDMIDIKKIGYKTKPHFKNDYVYFIKNPNILADMIVEIYNNNPNAVVYMPKKRTKLKMQYVVNKIDKDENIDDQYKEFVRNFRNIPGNTYIEYDSIHIIFKKFEELATKIFFKKLEIFLLFLRILKVARTGYFVIIFVIRLFKCSTVLKPALYTVVPFYL